MKLCKCCNLGHPTKVCTCSEAEIIKYRSRLSGALADRIDMHLNLAPVALSRFGDGDMSENSTAIRVRVERSRATQRERYAQLKTTTLNAAAPRRLLWRSANGDARELLRAASESLGLSARGYDRALRVARTIADLAECETISEAHVAEAVRYRPC